MSDKLGFSILATAIVAGVLGFTAGGCVGSGAASDHTENLILRKIHEGWTITILHGHNDDPFTDPLPGPRLYAIYKTDEGEFSTSVPFPSRYGMESAIIHATDMPGIPRKRR